MQSYASPGRVITIANSGPGAVDVRRDQPYRLRTLIGVTQHGAVVDADLNLCVEGMYDQVVDLAEGVTEVEAGSPVLMADDGTWRLVAGVTDTTGFLPFGIVTERMTRRRIVQVKLMPATSVAASGGGGGGEGTDPALVARVGEAEVAILAIDERVDGAEQAIVALQAGGGSGSGGGGGSSGSKLLAIGGWMCGPYYTPGQSQLVTSYGATGQPIRGDALVTNNDAEFVWPASRDGSEPESKSYIKALQGGVYEIDIAANLSYDANFPPNIGLEFRYSIWDESGASVADNIPISIGVGPYPAGFVNALGSREASIMRLALAHGGRIRASGIIFLAAGFTIGLSAATYRAPGNDNDYFVQLSTGGYDTDLAYQNSYNASIVMRRV